MSLEDSGFVGASLSTKDAPAGAAQYSFFGDLGGGLGGALEDDLEAPPEEEVVDPDLALDADEDLSYASMFALALGRGDEEDHSAAAAQTSTRPSLFAEALAATPPASKPKPSSIALGGLLTASTPSDTALSGGLPSASGSFLGTPSSFAPTPQSAQPGAPSAYYSGQPATGAPLALTAQELEAQLLAGAQPRQVQPQPPPQQLQQLPPFMQPYPGMMQGLPPQPAQFPPPGYGYAPPPGFPGMPVPMPMQQPRPQPGLFTPEMIMAQQRAQQQQQQHMAMAMRPPPGGVPPSAMAAPPPPLGDGATRGPPRPPFFPGFAGGLGGVPKPRPAPGMAVRPQTAPQPHANLAQRLRALNLADRPEAERYPTQQRRRYTSKYMDSEEIESIMYQQWRPLHQGPPYTEDYYYQAFVFKYYGRRNRRHFCPESVRELAPTEKMAADEVAFVKLEGLGKVPFSNVRRPRPLMEVSPGDLKAAAAGEESGAKGAADAAPPTRRLEQEPMLAARIMIEDCMALILDVQDIDRIFVAAAGSAVENEAALRQRRTLLVDGLAASLRLPETPTVGPAPGKDAGSALGDGVFLRLLALPKGKNLAARALRVLYPPAGEQPRGGAGGGVTTPNLRILWAVLRNLLSLFGDVPPAPTGGKASATDQTATSAKVAAAAAEVLKRLHSPRAVCDALQAVMAGDLNTADQLEANPEAVLMPLRAPGQGTDGRGFPWLDDVLAALLQRAAEFELSTSTLVGRYGGDKGAEVEAAWKERFAQLYVVALRHVSALHEAFEAAQAEGDAKGKEEVQGMMPVQLVRSLLPHCSKAQQEELRTLLAAVGV